MLAVESKIAVNNQQSFALDAAQQEHTATADRVVGPPNPTPRACLADGLRAREAASSNDRRTQKWRQNQATTVI